MWHAETVLLAADDPETVLQICLAFTKGCFTNPLRLVRDGKEALAYLKREGEYSNRRIYHFQQSQECRTENPADNNRRQRPLHLCTCDIGPAPFQSSPLGLWHSAPRKRAFKLMELPISALRYVISRAPIPPFFLEDSPRS